MQHSEFEPNDLFYQVGMSTLSSGCCGVGQFFRFLFFFSNPFPDSWFQVLFLVEHHFVFVVGLTR